MVRLAIMLATAGLWYYVVGLLLTVSRVGPIVGSAVLVLAWMATFAAGITLMPSNTRSAPWVIGLGFVLGGLAPVCFVYGIYTAKLSGWNGLDVSTFGSDDYRGRRWIASFVLAWTPGSALLGVVSAYVARRWPGRHPTAIGR